MNATSFLFPVDTQNRPTTKAKGVKRIMTRIWKAPAIREWDSLALLDTQLVNTHQVLSRPLPLSHAHTHICTPVLDLTISSLWGLHRLFSIFVWRAGRVKTQRTRMSSPGNFPKLKSSLQTCLLHLKGLTCVCFNQTDFHLGFHS